MASQMQQPQARPRLTQTPTGLRYSERWEAQERSTIITDPAILARAYGHGYPVRNLHRRLHSSWPLRGNALIRVEGAPSSCSDLEFITHQISGCTGTALSTCVMPTSALCLWAQTPRGPIFTSEFRDRLDGYLIGRPLVYRSHWKRELGPDQLRPDDETAEWELWLDPSQMSANDYDACIADLDNQPTQYPPTLFLAVDPDDPCGPSTQLWMDNQRLADLGQVPEDGEDWGVPPRWAVSPVGIFNVLPRLDHDGCEIMGRPPLPHEPHIIVGDEIRLNHEDRRWWTVGACDERYIIVVAGSEHRIIDREWDITTDRVRPGTVMGKIRATNRIHWAHPMTILQALHYGRVGFAERSALQVTSIEARPQPDYLAIVQRYVEAHR